MTSVSPSQRPDRLAHPRIDRRRTGILQVDVARRARVFIRDEDGLRALEDLERIRHVGRARHAGQIALDLGIRRQPVLLVLFLLREASGLYGISSPSTTPMPGRHRADRAERQDRGRRHRPVRTRAQRQRRTRHVHLNVPVGLVIRLPDAVQIRMAVRRSRRPVGGGACWPATGAQRTKWQRPQ